MITLNILPPETKKEIKLWHLYKDLKTAMLLLVIYISIVAMLILFAKLFLQINFINLSQSVNTLVNDNQNSNKQIREIKAKINNITKIQKENVKCSNILKDIVNKTNDNIKFSKISLDVNKNKLILAGHAKTRDDLLNFKKQLEESKNYSNINLPINNLLERENINFNIQLEIKSYDFE